MDAHGTRGVSRYFVVTDGLVEACQRAYLSGHDRTRTVAHLSADEVTMIAVESLEADHLIQSLPQVFGQPLPPGTGDWAMACFAELLLQSATHAPNLDLVPREMPDHLRGDAWRVLERVLDSPTASPMLWYQDIYFDVAQAYRIKHDLRALELMKRDLAHALHHDQGSNADGILRDLAESCLWLDQLDRGLTLFSGLLHNDPSDVWTYNVMALICGDAGLVDLGLEATRRALECVEATGDPERLHDQFVDALDRLHKGEKRGREAEVDPPVLAELRAALALDFGAGRHEPVAALCRELIPDLDQVPVKRRLTVSDLTYTPARRPPSPQTARGLGRNDPCWCGSGKKYKRCHWRQDRRQQ